jgi:hypothetical protein
MMIAEKKADEDPKKKISLTVLLLTQHVAVIMAIAIAMDKAEIDIELNGERT